MSKPEKYSHIDFTPPEGVRKAAESGLRMRREHGRGGTAVGIARARDLSNGKEVSPSTVRRMKAFFDRHAQNSKAEGFRPGEKGYPSNGKIADLLWGGRGPGYAWAKKVVAQMEAADKKSSRSLRPYGSTFGMRPKVYVVSGPPGAGKTTYVNKHKGDNDVVFDFDAVMQALTGLPPHQHNENLVSYCTDIRNLIIKRAMRGSKMDRTWIVTTNVNDELKKTLSDVPVKYIEMDTPRDECMKRVESDPQREGVREETKKLIEDYFAKRPVDQRRAAIEAGIERRFLGSFETPGKADPELLRVEQRADPNSGKPQTWLVGYAARFGKESLLLGDFHERIDPAAFGLVGEKRDAEGKPLATRCLFNHDPNELLGRYPTTMRMFVDDKGLRYECLLPDTRRDIAELVERGDLRGSSFSFIVADGGERWTMEDGKSVRLVTRVKALLDCGPVTYPAYDDATCEVVKRSYRHYQERSVAEKKATDYLAVKRQYESFLAERRDCGRDEDGRFGSNNDCAGGEGSGSKPPSDSSGGKSPVLGKMIDRIAKGGKSPQGGSKYAEYKKDGGGNATIADLQKFIDDARKGQLERGGKSGGKNDDGGGVQTWSKGDNYPWTTKQVGHDDGYLQAQLPDGTKTQKYPFKGGDTSKAEKDLQAEIDEHKKKGKRSLDPKAVARDTIRYLRNRK